MSIKITSNRTIVKNIKVGTPLPAIKSIKIRNSLKDVADTSIPPGALPTGSIIIYNAVSEKWEANAYLNNQVIDAGDTF